MTRIRLYVRVRLFQKPKPRCVHVALSFVVKRNLVRMEAPAILLV